LSKAKVPGKVTLIKLTCKGFVKALMRLATEEGAEEAGLGRQRNQGVMQFQRRLWLILQESAGMELEWS
jgi:hypothetical protein